MNTFRRVETFRVRRIAAARRAALTFGRNVIAHFALCPDLDEDERAHHIADAYMIGYHRGAVDAITVEQKIGQADRTRKG